MLLEASVRALIIVDGNSEVQERRTKQRLDSPDNQKEKQNLDTEVRLPKPVPERNLQCSHELQMQFTEAKKGVLNPKQRNG